MQEDEIRERIQAALPDARVALEDLTGGGDHWSAVIVSSAFAGKPRVAQHQLVYRALGDAMRGPIHALALRTLTPDQAAEAGLPQE